METHTSRKNSTRLAKKVVLMNAEEMEKWELCMSIAVRCLVGSGEEFEQSCVEDVATVIWQNRFPGEVVPIT